MTIDGPISDPIKEKLSKAVKLLFENPGMKVNKAEAILREKYSTSAAELRFLKKKFAR